MFADTVMPTIYCSEGRRERGEREGKGGKAEERERGNDSRES